MEKYILHYDMDSFYAQVEESENNKYKNKPLVVGTKIITTANYPARNLGIHSTMSVKEALKIYASLIVLPVRINHYRSIGRKIQDLVRSLEQDCEFLSSDEGYVDITYFLDKYTLDDFAKKFKKWILKNTNLTCSIGIGYNKLTAKLSSEANKPNGIYIMKDKQDFFDYVKDKPIKIIPGIGKKTFEKFKDLNINSFEDLQKIDEPTFINYFGPTSGRRYYELVNGIDSRIVDSNKQRKSYGQETTFNREIVDQEFLFDVLKKQIHSLVRSLEKDKKYIKSITLKIKYSDFNTITRSKTIEEPTKEYAVILEVILSIFEKLYKKSDIRLIGVHLGSITNSRITQLRFKDLDSIKL